MKETKKSLFPFYKETSLQMERYRVYDFGEYQVKITEPQFIIVSDNGHRIGDKNLMSHYIPYGWIHLYWENKEPEKGQFYCLGRTK